MLKELKSIFIKLVLNFKGAKIGKSFTCVRMPRIDLINSDKLNLIIGNNVTFNGLVELKIRDNSEIIIEDNTKIDQGVRLNAANKSILHIKKHAKVMFYSQINAGADITIGKKTAISSHCTLTSSNHKYIKEKNFLDTGYNHKSIIIGQNVHIGVGCFISPGTNIGENCIIYPNSYINRNQLKKDSTYSGNPAKEI